MLPGWDGGAPAVGAQPLSQALPARALRGADPHPRLGPPPNPLLAYLGPRPQLPSVLRLTAPANAGGLGLPRRPPALPRAYQSQVEGQDRRPRATGPGREAPLLASVTSP